jgi:hypothetical protein
MGDYPMKFEQAILNHCGDDAEAWTKAYQKDLAKRGFLALTPNEMHRWFQNAIEHSHDVRAARRRERNQGD